MFPFQPKHITQFGPEATISMTTSQNVRRNLASVQQVYRFAAASSVSCYLSDHLSWPTVLSLAPVPFWTLICFTPVGVATCTLITASRSWYRMQNSLGQRPAEAQSRFPLQMMISHSPCYKKLKGWWYKVYCALCTGTVDGLGEKH